MEKLPLCHIWYVREAVTKVPCAFESELFDSRRSFFFLFTHLQCCPELFPSEICKCAALLSAILCLFLASCHCNGASIVNRALRAARLLYAKLNPFAIVSGWMCQNPVWTGLFCTVQHPRRVFLFLFSFSFGVCVLFLIPQWFQCPPQTHIIVSQVKMLSLSLIFQPSFILQRDTARK